MKRFRVFVVVMALLGIGYGIGVGAGAAAWASVPCRANGKTAPADQCAFWNMAEAANNQGYGNPTFKSFYVQQTSVGKFHSVWTGLVHYPGRPIRFTLTARRCGNTYVTFNHRKGTWWPRAC